MFRCRDGPSEPALSGVKGLSNSDRSKDLSLQSGIWGRGEGEGVRLPRFARNDSGAAECAET